ncbi:MAG: TPM domain-containing protein [bacterium]
MIFIKVLYLSCSRVCWSIGRFTGMLRALRMRAGHTSRQDKSANHAYPQPMVQFNFTHHGRSLEKVQQLKIGGKSREERGVLFLFDMKGQRLRIEVGYGLEEYLPDIFVGYLIRDHARDFFASGDLSTGLGLLVRMIHARIRDAVLGQSFDPRVLAVLPQPRHLSGGAGASLLTPMNQRNAAKSRDSLDFRERLRFTPQPTPETTYYRYLEWLSTGVFDPRVSIFPQSTQSYLILLPITKAYFDFILMSEYGKSYKIDTRGDVALLYFTQSPLLSPHFFVKTTAGWQLDINAAVKNTKNVTGGVYNWTYTGKDDIYSQTFADKLIYINGYIRIRDGDNRMLPTRNSPATSPTRNN